MWQTILCGHYNNVLADSFAVLSVIVSGASADASQAYSMCRWINGAYSIQQFVGYGMIAHFIDICMQMRIHRGYPA